MSLPSYLQPVYEFIDHEFSKPDGSNFTPRTKQRIRRRLMRAGAIVDVVGFEYVDVRVFDRPVATQSIALPVARRPGRPRVFVKK